LHPPPGCSPSIPVFSYECSAIGKCRVTKPLQPASGETTRFRQAACARSLQGIVNLGLERPSMRLRRHLELFHHIVIKVANQQIGHDFNGIRSIPVVCNVTRYL